MKNMLSDDLLTGFADVEAFVRWAVSAFLTR
jgi:hypothetical protein